MSQYIHRRYLQWVNVAVKATATDEFAGALEAIGEAERWKRDGSCAESGGDAWFPEKGESYTAALRVCRESCPIRQLCLDYAIERGEREGIWGGMTHRQRLNEIKRRQDVAAKSIGAVAA